MADTFGLSVWFFSRDRLRRFGACVTNLFQFHRLDDMKNAPVILRVDAIQLSVGLGFLSKFDIP